MWSSPFAHVRSRLSVHAERTVLSRNREAYEGERRAREQRLAEEEGRRSRNLDYAKERITLFHEQEIEKAAAIEELKASKRQVGAEMRVALQAAYEQVQEAAAARTAVVSAETHRTRLAKEAQALARHQHQKENAEMIAAQAKAERADRRQDALATVREQERMARELTARVRYETRPAVRQESASYFQRQRNEAYSEMKRQRNAQREQREQAEGVYINGATQLVQEVRQGDTVAVQSARQRLSDSRWHEAQLCRLQRRASLEESRLSLDVAADAALVRHAEIIRGRYVADAEMPEGATGRGEQEDEDGDGSAGHSTSAAGPMVAEWKASRNNYGSRTLSKESKDFKVAPWGARYTFIPSPGFTPRTPRRPRAMQRKSLTSLHVNLAQYN